MHPARPAGARPAAAAAALAALALATAAASAIDAGPLQPPLADHDVPAGAAHAVAQVQGWRFNAEASNPASICRLTVEGGTLVLSAGHLRGPVDAVCEFVLFGGDRTLAGGWKVSGLERTRTDRPSCEYRFLRFPVEDGAALAFHIRILAAPDEENQGPCTYALTGFVLRGPAGGDWREAFGP